MRASIIFGLALSSLALAGGDSTKPSQDNSATAASSAKADASGRDSKASAEAAAAAAAKGGDASAQANASASADGKGGDASASASAEANASSHGHKGGDASASASAEANASSDPGHRDHDPGHKHDGSDCDDPSDPGHKHDGSDCDDPDAPDDDSTDCDENGHPVHLGWWRGRYYGLYDPSCGFDYGARKYWVFDPKTCVVPVKVVKPVHVVKLAYDPPEYTPVVVFWTQIPGCEGPCCWRKGDYCDGKDCCLPCAHKRHYPSAPWGCFGDDCCDDGHGGCKGEHCCHGDECNPEHCGNAYASATSIASASGGNANALAVSSASASGRKADASALSIASASGKKSNAVAVSEANASS